MKHLLVLITLVLGAVFAYVVARDFARSAGNPAVVAPPSQLPRASGTRAKAHVDPFARAMGRAQSQSPAITHTEADFQPLPLGPFGSNVAELEQRANAGDAAAARKLADDFKDCRGFKPPKDAAQVAEQAEQKTAQQLDMIDEFRDWVNKKLTESGAEPVSVPDPPADKVYGEVLAGDRSRIERCTGVDPKSAENWSDWYRRAVELGDRDASLAYWRVVLDNAYHEPLEQLVQDRNLAVSAVSRVLAEGDSLALIVIGEMLDQGFFAAPDTFDAYAYASAATHASSSALSMPSTRPGFLWVGAGQTENDVLTQLLRRFGKSLDPREISQAERIGGKLYERCCGGGGK